MSSSVSTRAASTRAASTTSVASRGVDDDEERGVAREEESARRRARRSSDDDGEDDAGATAADDARGGRARACVAVFLIVLSVAVGTAVVVLEHTTGVASMAYARARDVAAKTTTARRRSRSEDADVASGRDDARLSSVSPSFSPPPFSPPPFSPPASPFPPPPKDETPRLTAQKGVDRIVDTKCDAWTGKINGLLNQTAKDGRLTIPPYECENVHHSPCLSAVPFLQLVPDACETMKTYDEWPGRYVAEASNADAGERLIAALGGVETTKRVFVIGASMAGQIAVGTQCTLRRAGLNQGQATQMLRRWGWARYSFDSKSCVSDEEHRQTWFEHEQYVNGCWKNTKVFDKEVLGCDERGKNCDSANRIVVFMYNMEHYQGMKNLPHYKEEVTFIVNHALEKGASVVLATSPPKHFSKSGRFDSAQYESQLEHIASMSGTCACTETTEDIAKDPEWSQYLKFIDELSRVDGVLGTVNMLQSSLTRYHGAHLGGTCGYYKSRGDDGDAKGPMTRIDWRQCCDCTHYCFDPALWDTYFIAPLVDVLSEQ